MSWRDTRRYWPAPNPTPRAPNFFIPTNPPRPDKGPWSDYDCRGSKEAQKSSKRNRRKAGPNLARGFVRRIRQFPGKRLEVKRIRPMRIFQNRPSDRSAPNNPVRRVSVSVQPARSCKASRRNRIVAATASQLRLRAPPQRSDVPREKFRDASGAGETKSPPSWSDLNLESDVRSAICSSRQSSFGGSAKVKGDSRATR